MLLLHAVEAPSTFVIKACEKAKRSRRDILRIRIRSLYISCNSFNLNMYSDEWSLRDFRFQVKHIGRISACMGWISGKTERNGYKCDPITAYCIVLLKLASPCRWKDVEYLFGMHAPALSEVFWEVVETFVEGKGYLLTDLREGMLADRAELYADSIKNAGAPLDSCVGFIDCTEIKMTRPGGNGVAIQVTNACTALYTKP